MKDSQVLGFSRHGPTGLSEPARLGKAFSIVDYSALSTAALVFDVFFWQASRLLYSIERLRA